MTMKNDIGFKVPRYNKFTIMPNTYLHDQSVSLNARGIMATMFSLPEDWDFSAAGLIKILPDGARVVKGALKELEEHGYLIREQVKDSKGRFGKMNYILVPDPKDVQSYVNQTQEFYGQTSVEQKQMQKVSVHQTKNYPLAQNELSAKNMQNITNKQQMQENLPQAHFATAENPTAVDVTQYNTKEYSRSVSRSVCRSSRTHAREVIHNIHNQIDYQSFCEKGQQDIVDAVVGAIYYGMTYKEDSMTLNDIEYATEDVQERLQEINHEDVEYVVSVIDQYPKKIFNPRKFILSVLMTSATELNLFYKKWVQRDMST